MNVLQWRWGSKQVRPLLWRRIWRLDVIINWSFCARHDMTTSLRGGLMEANLGGKLTTPIMITVAPAFWKTCPKTAFTGMFWVAEDQLRRWLKCRWGRLSRKKSDLQPPNYSARIAPQLTKNADDPFSDGDPIRFSMSSYLCNESFHD